MGGVRVVSVVVCMVCSGVAAGRAAADEGDHDKAVEAFRAARADIEAGDCAAAIPKLEESLAHEPSVGAHLSIADCYEQVDLVAAWRKLQDAADLAEAKSDPRVGIARERAAALEPRLSMVHFAYAPEGTDLSGLQVRIDGSLEPLLRRRGSLPTTPGAHDVEVSLPHKKTWRGRVVARSGTIVEVSVALEDEAVVTNAAAAVSTASSPDQPGPPADEAPPRGRAQQTAAFWTGGAGLVGMGAGAVFGIVALSDNAKLRDACGGNVHRCDAPNGSSNVTQLQSDARVAATVSTVGFVLGGVALATGIVLYATAPSARRVAVRAIAAPRAGGISVEGPFD
jgi:hypothetical protein